MKAAITIAILFLLLALLLVIVFLTRPAAAADGVQVELREEYSLGQTTIEWGSPVSQRAYRYGTARAHTKTWETTLGLEGEVARFLGSVRLGLGATAGGEVVHNTANVGNVSVDRRPYSLDVGGGTIDVRVGAGYRLLDGPRFQLDALGGVRYRREEFNGQGARGPVLGTLSRASGGLDGRTSTTTTEWVSPYLELRARYSFTQRLSLYGSVQGTPWQWTAASIDWPYRYDLRHTSLSGSTTGGWAAAGLLGLRYQVTDLLAIKVGVEGSYLRSGSDIHDFHFHNRVPDCRQPRCGTPSFQLRATSASWGPFVGVELRW